MNLNFDEGNIKLEQGEEKELVDHETIEVPSEESESHEGGNINITEFSFPFVRTSNSKEKVITNLFENNFMLFLKNELKNSNYAYSENIRTPLKRVEKIKVFDQLKNLGIVIAEYFNYTVIKDIKSNSYFVVNLGLEFGCKSLLDYVEIHIYSNTKDNLLKSKELYLENIQKFDMGNEIYAYISWFFSDDDGRIKSADIQESLNDEFLIEGYPYLKENYLENYIKDDESVLILLGCPGSGKTRLIRYILKMICQEKEKRLVRANFSCDQKVIESSNIFMDFIMNSDKEVLILEDIDYHLQSRKNGNTSMYQFLSISNNILVNYSRKKKIILSTNLPNVDNIDEALLRPGRCYGVLKTRALELEEARKFMKALGRENVELNGNRFTLAELYNQKLSAPKAKCGF